MSNPIGYNILQIHIRIRHEKIRENTQKTAKTYAMTINEAGPQEIDYKALESSGDPLEKLNFTQENTLLLPILDNIYIGKTQHSITRSLYTYDIFVEIYENDIQKDAMHFYGHESNNFCYDAFFPNDFLNYKNNDKASIVKLDEIGASETFYEFELEPKEEFDIKKFVYFKHAFERFRL